MTNNITVPVPDERIAEFYQFFGLWLAGALSLTETQQSPAETSATDAPPAEPQKRKAWTGSDEDLEDAIHLWGKFSKHARAFFGLLINNPGTHYTGHQAAEAVGIPNGAHGVAGVLAWPGRHAWAIQRYLPSRWKDDEDAGASYYWMTPELAKVFKAAREKVEGAA